MEKKTSSPPVDVEAIVRRVAGLKESLGRFINFHSAPVHAAWVTTLLNLAQDLLDKGVPQESLALLCTLAGQISSVVTVFEHRCEDLDRSLEEVKARQLPKSPQKSAPVEKKITNFFAAEPNAANSAAHLVTVFPEVSFTTPRGTFVMEVFHDGSLNLVAKRSKKETENSSEPQSFRLTGASSLFRLKTPNSDITNLIVYLRRPLVIGKSTHSILLIPLKATLWWANLNLEYCSDAQKSELSPSIKGKPADLMCTILSSLCKSPVHEYEKSLFGSPDGSGAIGCYFKAAEGFLYPLRTAVVFVGRPSMVFWRSDIEDISIGRAGGMNRNVDLVITVKGETKSQVYSFDMIQKEQMDHLIPYLQDLKKSILDKKKKLPEEKTGNEGDAEEKMEEEGNDDGDGEDDEEDEEEEEDGNDDDDDDDEDDESYRDDDEDESESETSSGDESAGRRGEDEEKEEEAEENEEEENEEEEDEEEAEEEDDDDDDEVSLVSDASGDKNLNYDAVVERKLRSNKQQRAHSRLLEPEPEHGADSDTASGDEGEREKSSGVKRKIESSASSSATTLKKPKPESSAKPSRSSSDDSDIRNFFFSKP